MWERDALLPELEKIAPVATCDLRSALSTAHGTPAEVVSKALRTWIGSSSPEADVVLFYARPSLLSEEAFALIRRRWAGPLLGLNLDDKTNFLPYGIFADGNDNYRRWAPRFDLNLSSNRLVTEWYREAGASAIFLPEGFHPDPGGGPLAAEISFQHALSFVGSWKQEREPIVRALLDAGVPLSVFGQGWSGAQWIDSPAEVFRSSQLNLGIGCATTSLTALKARDFECPGAGGCYLTTYNWELEQCYELGREILCYRSTGELLEMYGFFRRHPAECRRIASAGYRRCLATHTWEQRFRGVFRELGFAA
jgi:hypothetical protein